MITLTEENTMQQILKELKEIKKWIRLSGLPALRRAVEENLRDDASKWVYQLSDGERSTSRDS